MSWDSWGICTPRWVTVEYRKQPPGLCSCWGACQPARLFTPWSADCQSLCSALGQADELLKAKALCQHPTQYCVRHCLGRVPHQAERYTDHGHCPSHRPEWSQEAKAFWLGLQFPNKETNIKHFKELTKKKAYQLYQRLISRISVVSDSEKTQKRIKKGWHRNNTILCLPSS